MATYAILLPVSPRTEATFKREDIEQAARITFYTSPPAEFPINTPPEELRLDWHQDMITGHKVVRVIGDVDPGESAPLTDESWWVE